MLLRLLRYLLEYFMFAGTMFFAAGAVADAGGAGGSDAATGDTAGVGDAGDSEGDAGASTEAEGGAEGDLDAGAGEGSEKDLDADAPVDLGGGRTVPAKIDKLFKLAKTAGVEKEVRQLYFSNERLNKAIPGGVNAAIKLASDIEQVGGVEGIESLQSDLDAHRQDSELFERGDPKWIESAFQENPESALKAFNNALAYVGEHNSEHYDHVMAKVMIDTLDRGSPVASIYNLLAGLKDNQAAQQAAQKLAEWYNAVKDTASKVPEKKIDAQQKALSDREAQVEQREMATRYTQVNTEVFPVMKSQVTRTLEAEAKLKNLDLTKIAADSPGEFRAMMNEIHQEIMKAATKDQRFIDKHYALVKKGDLKRAAAAVNAKHEKLIPEIVVRVAGTYGFMRGAKKSAAKPGAGAGKPGGEENASAQNAGWERVSSKPAQHLIDFSRSPLSLTTQGKYILKDGKKVAVHY